MRRLVSEPDQHNLSVNSKVSNQELFHAPQEHDGLAPESPVSPVRKSSLIFVLLFGVAIVACLAVIASMQKRPNAPNIPPDADDLGQGVANASGLRGHLVTRWQKGKAQYMLKIEPLDPRDAVGFSNVTSNPSEPIAINIRVLDSAGFALCGKEIDLRFDPTRSLHANAALTKKSSGAHPPQQAALQQAVLQETARESNKDLFQNIVASDGSVEALWAQGELPCSPDQYRRFDYWDLTTNFPTVGAQDQSTGRPHAESAEGAAKAKRKLAARGPVSNFYIEGDDRVTAYESSRSLLVLPGRSFYIPSKSDQTTVADWASDSALIHFKCDQQENCSLRTGAHAVYGRVNN